jgi:signal peptidase II
MDDLKQKEATKSLLLPFTLTVIIIIADQITKLLIVKSIQPNTIGLSIFNDFFRIIHTRNLGIAFSIGYDLPSGIRTALFILFPALVIIALFFFYFKEKDLPYGMRWALAGIVGGGFGNLIDRIFRPLGVVDFASLKFFGIFGMQRFPAFNVADSSVVVSSITLILMFIIWEGRNRE